MQQVPIHIRRLRIYTDRPFIHRGADLRRAITGAFPDRPVLHNHLGDRFDYRSPRVRYVVLGHQPQLISFDEGLHVLEEIYRSGHSLRVERECYEITGTELEDEVTCLGTGDDLLEYRSVTPWLALNEENHVRYRDESDLENRRAMLGKILNGNYLSLCKGAGIRVEERLMTRIFHFDPVLLSHRGTELVGMMVSFISNMILPDGIGLGKLVSKGFGVMRKV